MSLLRTINTVRFLKPVQVVNRVARGLRAVHLPAQDVVRAHRLLHRPPEPPAWPHRELWDGDGFRFVGQRRAFAGSDRWSPAGAPRLWKYNLHYFGYLWEVEPARALALVTDWLDGNPPVQGTGWEPYPTSLRVREWLEWLLASPELPAAERDHVVASLVAQVCALEQRLEWHLLGNHLLENAITLCWAGLSVDGPLAARWRERGLALLDRELAAQVLGDGAHAERSPMYQALLTEALARLGGVARSSSEPAGAPVAALAGEAAARMLASLSSFCHPDGGIALLNDSAFGVAPTLAQLAARFPALGAPVAANGVWHLPGAGFLGWRRGDGYLALDAGPIGPDHQPGHGHAGALSFELSHRGRRLITDTGVMTYEPGEVRSWDRGTPAHSTVTVDGRDQSEVWAAFRCGRRIRITDASAGARGDGVSLGAAYAGPGRGLTGVWHQRELRLAAGVVHGLDVVAARGTHWAVARLHLAPGLSVRREGESWAVLGDAGVVARVGGDGAGWTEGRSPYHPELGAELDRVCLAWRVSFADRAELRWRIELV